MELLKIVDVYEQATKKARKLEKELNSTLCKVLIDLPYEMREVQIKEIIKSTLKEEKLYYPELTVPQGYKKESEEYIADKMNVIKHQYILKNHKGRKISIVETAEYDNYILHTIKGRIEIPFNIAGKTITYDVTISNRTYTFYRDFEYADMFLAISGNEESKAKHEFSLTRYSEANKQYEEFIRALGISKVKTSLGDIVNSKCEEIMLGKELKAEIKIAYANKDVSTGFKNKSWTAYINQIPYSEICVQIILCSIRGLQLREEKFTWHEIKNNNYRKGITLQEAIKLIKK